MTASEKAPETTPITKENFFEHFDALCTLLRQVALGIDKLKVSELIYDLDDDIEFGFPSYDMRPGSLAYTHIADWTYADIISYCDNLAKNELFWSTACAKHIAHQTVLAEARENIQKSPLLKNTVLSKRIATQVSKGEADVEDNDIDSPGHIGYHIEKQIREG